MAPTTPPSSGVRKRRVASPGNEVKTPTLPRERVIPDTTPEGPQDSVQHDTKARSDGVDTHLLQDHGLLSLPCELLEMTASRLLGTTHILSLGLVNKRIGRIVQQTIVRNLIVSRRNIRGFLGMLGGHAKLISKISRVDLGDFGCSHQGGCLCVGTKSLDPDILEALGTAVAATTGHVVDWSLVRESNNSVGPVWRREPAFLLDVLASSCPSIKSMTIQLPEARPFHIGQPPRPICRAPLALPALNPELLPVAPFQGPALQVFQEKLEALTISENTRWKGPPTDEVLESHNLKWRNMGTYIITLANFSRLKRLDIPMDILGRPDDIIFSGTSSLSTENHDVTAGLDGAIPAGKMLAELRSKVLPLTIEYLHLRSCNKWMFALLQRINEVPVEDLRLKHIELFFETSPKHLIMRCDAADLGRLDYLRLLTGLDRKGIKVAFRTGPQGVPVDMCEELEALSRLTPFEVWRCSPLHTPFSTWNTEASKKRRSLAIGFRYFLQHIDHHSQLLNSPTFDLKLWRMPGVFFHGIKNSKSDPQLQDPKMKVRTVVPAGWDRRALGKQAFKRRLSPLLNLDTYLFDFQIDQKLTPLPKESQFLGTSFTTTDDMRAQPSDQHRDTAKKPHAHEEQTKRGKQNNRVEFALDMTTEVHDLKDDIERLRLGSVNNHPSASQFSATVWASVTWKNFLQPKTARFITDV